MSLKPHPYPNALTGKLVAMETLIDEGLLAVKDEEQRREIPDEVANATALRLWEDGDMESLAQFEACLREIGSKVFCIAVPSYAEGGHAVDPTDEDAELRFALSVAYGLEARTQAMSEWELTPEENMNRLAIAGLSRAVV